MHKTLVVTCLWDENSLFLDMVPCFCLFTVLLYYSASLSDSPYEIDQNFFYYLPISRSKEIANFHRPKARWYPHENSAFAKSHRTLGSHGTMKIILLSLGGKGIKLHVEAGETLSSVKSKASKKLGQLFPLM